MRLLFTALLLISLTGCLFAQVSNIRVAQRTDGNFMVDIYYDFSNPQGYNTEIAVEASNDNGATWDLKCVSLSGDLGVDITAGTDKHIVWDFYADNPNTSGSQFKVCVLYYFFSTMTGNDGTVYKTVKIGDQWWMAENLKETQYRNGDEIPKVDYNTSWKNISTGARYGYSSAVTFIETYGYLYNWYAVNDSRSIAPNGWHVPTDDEWNTLQNTLGGTMAGGKLKETGTTHWDSPNTGATNKSRFTALPGGYRFDKISSLLGSSTDFWSSTQYVLSGNPQKAAWTRGLYNGDTEITRSNQSFTYGFSIRLVKD